MIILLGIGVGLTKNLCIFNQHLHKMKGYCYLNRLTLTKSE